MKLILIRCTVVLVLAMILFGVWHSLASRSWVKNVTHMTNGAGIPVSGKVLGIGPTFRQGFNMSPDRHIYIVFQCSEHDIHKFATRFSEGTSVDDWERSPTRFGPTIWNYSDVCPNFDLTKIKNGRYWHVPGIVCAIDVDRNIVYIID